MQKVNNNIVEASMTSQNKNENANQVNDINYSSESSRMRYLIKKNEEENIDFISTLIRLKGRNVNSKINSNEKNIQLKQNHISSIFNLNNIKPDDESKSSIKEILDICGNTNSNLIGSDTLDLENELNNITPRRNEMNKEMIEYFNKETEIKSSNKGVLHKMFKEVEEIEKMLSQKQYLNSNNKKKPNVKVFSCKTDKYGVSNSIKNKENVKEINYNEQKENDVKHRKTNTKSSITSNNTDNSDTSSILKFSNVSDKTDFEFVNNVQICNENENNCKMLFNPDNNYFTNIIQEENKKIKSDIVDKSHRKAKKIIPKTTEINLFDDNDNDIENNNTMNYDMIKSCTNIKEYKTLANIVNSVEPIEEKRIEIDLDDLLTPKYIFSTNKNINNNIHKQSFKHFLIKSHSFSEFIISSHKTKMNENNKHKLSKSFCNYISKDIYLLFCQKEKKENNKQTIINNFNKGNSTRQTTSYKHQNHSLRKSQPIIKNTKNISNKNNNKKTLSIIKQQKYKFESLSLKRRTPAPQMKKQIFNINININVNKSIKNPKSGKIIINNSSKDVKRETIKSNNISLDNYFKNVFSQQPSKKTNKLVKRTNNSQKGIVNTTPMSIGSSKIKSFLNTSENVIIDTITSYNNINLHNE